VNTPEGGVLIHSFAIKYIKLVGMIEFYVYVTDFAFKGRKIYPKNAVYIVRITVTIS
jgi:hypothetical protein